jgi:hypothetical protein
MQKINMLWCVVGMLGANRQIPRLMQPQKATPWPGDLLAVCWIKVAEMHIMWYKGKRTPKIAKPKMQQNTQSAKSKKGH